MKVSVRKCLRWLCCAALLPALGVAAPTQADLVLYNGKIITVDDAFSVKSTLVIRGEKILAVGGPEIAARYSAPQRIDLHGRVVMPGFIDTHAHIIGTSHREVDLSNATSVEEVKSLVAAKAQELGPGEWVVGDDYDETKFTDHRRPLRWDLDAAAPNNPVFLYRDGRHGSVANSLALRAAGITRYSSDTQKYVIEHYSDGEPNGFVRESLQLFMPLIPVDSPQQMRAGYIAGIRRFLPLGITSAIIAHADLKTLDHPNFPTPSWPEWQSIYAELGGELPRLAVQIRFPGAEALREYPHHTGYGDDRLKLSAIGEGPVVDGGFSGPTACTTHDYKGQPGFRGRCLLTPEELQDAADATARYGWQLALHMLGDAAIDEAIVAYDRALARYPQRDPRWFTSHFAMLPSKKTLELMVKDHISASAQPNFLVTLEQRYRDVLEGDALEHVNPVATPQKLGILVAFGSDDMPTDPRVGLYAAVTRKGKSGNVLGPSEAVSIQDAIRMYTRNPAYLTWDEHKKGTLEAGKFADVIVLDRDPLTCPPEQLLQMHVDLNVVGGKILFERAQAAH